MSVSSKERGKEGGREKEASGWVGLKLMMDLPGSLRSASAGGWQPRRSAIPCCARFHRQPIGPHGSPEPPRRAKRRRFAAGPLRSEEHTSELQSRQYLVC